MVAVAPITAVLVTAGNGSRFGGAVPKQFQVLNGAPVYQYALEVLQSCALIQQVIIVSAADRYASLQQQHPACIVVAGGATRQASVAAALPYCNTPYVLVHDAVRPLITPTGIDALYQALQQQPAWQGVIAAVPVVDTLKQVQADGTITATIPRDGVYQAQTPQLFHAEALKYAHHTAMQQTTDDAALIEAAGGRVGVAMGGREAMKITTPEDWHMVEKLAGSVAMALPRVGHGFDVHRFGNGQYVTLCGVAIPHSHGLVGHSDADVAWHALTDALFGAIASGDIGQHFPPSDPQWRGAASGQFLQYAAAQVRQLGGRICHVDMTIACEAPKLAPHTALMREATANCIGLTLQQVGLKATTTEKLGFTGRGEGIAAWAVATVLL